MKHIYLIAFLLFIININAQEKSKCYQVEYSKRLTKTNITNKISDQNVSNRVARLSKSLESLKYSLIFNKKEASFYFLDELKNDSNKRSNRAIGMAGGNGIYYRNKIEKLHQFEITSDLLLISHSLNQYKWKINNDKKIILGKTCYKATGTYIEKTESFGEKIINVTAWYTPEIPVLFGPAGYDGLPGLVLEAHIGRIYFSAESIKKTTCKEIIKPVKGHKMTISESLKYLDKLYKMRQ